MSTHGCLSGRLLASCSGAAMEVQVYTCSIYTTGLASNLTLRGGGSLVYWATTRADTWLKNNLKIIQCIIDNISNNMIFFVR